MASMIEKDLKDWLPELEEPHRVRALNNVDAMNENPKQVLLSVFPTMSAALDNAFIWAESPEGDEYWIAIHDRYQNLEINSTANLN